MIRAKFRRDGQRVAVFFKGHGGGTKGRDLVCAGASTLLTALAQTALELEGRRPPRIRLQEGNGAVVMYPKRRSRREAEAAADFCQRGMELLQRYDPGAVLVDRR